ncbi:MAG: nitroreductase [Solobacterium sp.]|nr:nitroreductase [Solobacterium sp.]
MGEMLEGLKNRRSVRKYTDEIPSEELLKEVMEAGLYAASGMGKQAPIIIAVTNREVRDRLSKMNADVMGADSDPFYGAPAVLIVLADKAVGTYIYDGSLVMGNMMNAAYDMGLAACWIHRAKEMFETEEGKAILKSLGIEGEYEGIGNLIIGFSAEAEKAPAPRKAGRMYFIR